MPIRHGVIYSMKSNKKKKKREVKEKKMSGNGERIDVEMTRNEKKRLFQSAMREFKPQYSGGAR